MCPTCGCLDAPRSHHRHVRFLERDEPRSVHEGGETQRLRLEKQALGRNRLAAARNRGFFDGRRVLALNFVSSPGSGTTSLLERSIAYEAIRRAWFVVQGDPATDHDAERVRRKGARAVQLNTGTGCHLDAATVARAVAELDPRPGGILAIENGGNLVRPALFDLGEHARVVIASVTEGDDKPMKYPTLFRSASLVVLNKIDLLPHVEFDVRTFSESVRGVNGSAPILAISAARGDGMATWYRWLDELLNDRVSSRPRLVSLG